MKRRDVSPFYYEPDRVLLQVFSPDGGDRACRECGRMLEILYQALDGRIQRGRIPLTFLLRLLGGAAFHSAPIPCRRETRPKGVTPD